MLGKKTPCCQATVKATGLNEVGDSASRKCKVCGACYIVTVVPSTVGTRYGAPTTLEYRLTRKSKSDARPQPTLRAPKGAKPTMSPATTATFTRISPDAARIAVLAALVHLGGSVVDRKSGRATRLLFEAMPSGTVKSNTPDIIAGLEHDGHVVRDMNGRRTYEIALVEVPPALATRVDETVKALANGTVAQAGVSINGHAPSTNGAESAGAVSIAEANTDEGSTPSLPAPSAAAPLDAVAVAEALITAFVDKLSEPGVADIRKELELQGQRLSEVLDDNQRLRTKNKDMSQELYEVHGALREAQLRIANLKDTLANAMKSVDRQVRERLQGELDRMMRARPSSKGE